MGIYEPCSDPPDYVVNSAYAVEVRRLNQRIERRLSLCFLSWGAWENGQTDLGKSEHEHRNLRHPQRGPLT